LPVALITGASRGIGEAGARHFAAAGFDLLLLSRSQGPLASLSAELRAAHPIRVEMAVVDLGDPLAIAPGITELCSRGLVPSVLINNAGAAWTGPLAEMPLERWQWLFQLNVTSVFQICQAVLPLMRAQEHNGQRTGGGLIINVSSHASRNAFTDWGAYSASKAALQAFGRTLAAEERQHGIRVSTLTLGSVNTPLWDTETVHSNFDRRAMLPVEQAAEALLVLAQQPSSQVVDELTLMPAAGAF
jgi:short-subunit dehydrogenase